MAESYEEKSDQTHELATEPDLPERLNAVHSNIMAAAPNMGNAINQTAQKAAAFLQTKNPPRGAQAFEDSKNIPSKSDQNHFLQYHSIVSDPVSALDHVKNGTLTDGHLEALQNVYPDLHNEMKTKMVEELADMKSKGKSLPYNKRQAVSRFIGMPLDSTMSPQSMQAIIQSAGGTQAPQSQGKPPKKASGVELKEIGKTNDLYATKLQSREMDKKG